MRLVFFRIFACLSFLFLSILYVILLLRLREGCEVLRSACLSVCPLACLENDMSKLHEIFCTCYNNTNICNARSVSKHTESEAQKLNLRRVSRSSSDDSAIGCVLPVLWMTSRFSHNRAYVVYSPRVTVLSFNKRGSIASSPTARCTGALRGQIVPLL